MYRAMYGYFYQQVCHVVAVLLGRYLIQWLRSQSVDEYYLETMPDMITTSNQDISHCIQAYASVFALIVSVTFILKKFIIRGVEVLWNDRPIETESATSNQDDYIISACQSLTGFLYLVALGIQNYSLGYCLGLIIVPMYCLKSLLAYNKISSNKRVHWIFGWLYLSLGVVIVSQLSNILLVVTKLWPIFEVSRIPVSISLTCFSADRCRF